jgi:hypothetical protein
VIGGGGALAAIAAVRIFLWPPSPEPPPRAIALAVERSVEVRFSAPALDHHRPYDPMRALGAAPPEQISWAVLADLDDRRDLNALVAASALKGDLLSAERTARAQPRTVRTLSDLAAIELLRTDATIDRGPRAVRNTAAERALSLATDALRLDPGHPQAKWNRAIALQRLGLSLAAARTFDEIAALREPGWADEARRRAQDLNDKYRRSTEDWRHTKDDADRMILGGPVLSDQVVSRVPSRARDAFYQALATAATVSRIDELARLARALDAQFATTVLGELTARVRASDLASRAPLAAELKAFIEGKKPVESVADLRARALRRGHPDLVLASFLAVNENDADDADIALLDKLLVGNRDPWWQLVQLARRAWLSEFRHRDYPAVDAIERLAGPLCKTARAGRCWQIGLLAGGANSQMGRADLAFEKITGALQQAKAATEWNDELDALDALGQAIANRFGDDFDSAAVAGAYLEEVALRKPVCATRLQRLDFVAVAELEYHRFGDAARARSEAVQLENGECRSASLRLNGETVTLRLLLRGRASLGSLRDDLTRLEAERRASRKLYLEFLRAGAMLAEDPQRGEPALRDLITRATANPDQAFAPLVRASAFDVLTESVAVSGGARAVLALLTERLSAPTFERCVLGLASWNRLIVALLDGDGTPALETREIPEGVVMIPPSEVISPAMRARLAGCRRVDVIASRPYFGAARLLGDDLAWVYHTGTPRARAPRPPAPTHELIVSDVTPPDDLHLPALLRLSGTSTATVLSGASATPANVLSAMKSADLVVIAAHGLTDANEPTAASLILSPDSQGDYLLTASKVSSAQLAGAPIVALAGCDAGRVQVSDEPWSLATSFIAAGARVVIAPTEPVPDTGADEVFRSLVERIRGGDDAVDALAAERRARPAVASWLSSIVVFE